MDKDTKKHFEESYESVTFLPPLEIKFAVYSAKIWKLFLDLLPDKKSKVIDFGCGGGTCLYCLEEQGYKNLLGMDFCDSIPEGFLHHTQFIKGDVVRSDLKANDFDGLISTMVIEHVDEIEFVNEVHRILKKGGVALITSVLKGRLAWYPYKNKKGESVVEPTHVKEYHSIREYADLFKEKFDIIFVATPRLAYPYIDPIFRILFKITRWEYLRTFPTRNYFFKKIRKLRLPIPGYYSIEILVKKK